MGRYVARIKWKTTKCKHCGCHHNTWIYVYKGGSCARTFGTTKGAWAFDKNAIKSKATFRVTKADGEWVKHPTKPAWKDDKPVVNCCAHFGKVTVKSR